MDLAAHGLTDKEIALRLGIRDGTVATYWERIRAKLGPHHRSELVAMATQEASLDTVEHLQAEVAALEERLRQGEREARAAKCLSDCAPEALCALDEEGAILALNPAGEQMLGATAAEVIGTSFAQWVPPHRVEAYRQGLRALIGPKPGPERIRTFRIEILGQRQHPRVVRVLVTPCGTRTGRLVELSTWADSR